MKEFIRQLEEALPCPAYTSSVQRWEYLRDTIYNAASLTFGKKQAKTADWFEAHLYEIQPFIDEKRHGLASYKAHPVREHSKCLGWPEAKSNRFQGVVQINWLLKELHEILCQCWREGEVPQDMRDADIATLYKNKGDSNNYCGISLLNIVGKLFGKVVLMKLRVLAERIYPES